MPNLELAAKWLAYAKTDYDIAVHDTTYSPVPIEIICYHCQQVGEKALKAILAFHDHEIPRTHDLYRLLELCNKMEPMLPDLTKQALELSDFAVVPRYPSPIELDETDMNTALHHAEAVLKVITELLT